MPSPNFGCRTRWPNQPVSLSQSARPVADGLPLSSRSQTHFFYALLRQLADKARRAVINPSRTDGGFPHRSASASWHGGALRRRRPGATLLQAAAFIKGHNSAREHPFFDADDEHLRNSSPSPSAGSSAEPRPARCPFSPRASSGGEERLQRHQIFIFFVIVELARRRHQLP